MTPSLGEAISLQGRNTIAEQIGRMSFQATENEKSRLGKQQADAADAAKLQQKEVLDLFKRTGTMHRLVVPKANEVVTEAFNEMLKIRSSGSPYASNKYAEVLNRAQTAVSTLQAQSKSLEDFDMQLRMLDRSKKYFGRGFEQFIPLYQRAERIEQLQALTEQNPELMRGRFFNLNPEGLPSVTPVEAIPYEKELSTRVKSMPAVLMKTDVDSPGGVYGTKFVRDTSVVPVTIAQKMAVAKANQLKPENVPSIEEAVENYLAERPEAIFQIADKLGIEFDQDGDGFPDLETQQRVKEHLMDMSVAYAKNTQRSSAVYAPRPASGGTPAAQMTDDELGIKGGTIRAHVYTPTPHSYESKAVYTFEGNVPTIRVDANARVTPEGNYEAAKSDLVNAKPDYMDVLPYFVDGSGFKRPIKKGDTSKTVAGYHPFVHVDNKTAAAWVDVDYFSPATLGGSSPKEIEVMATRIKRLKELAAGAK